MLDILDLKDYKSENNRGYRYVLVVFDNISKFGWTVSLKNKNAQTEKDSLESILKNSKSKANLFESDSGKKYYKNNFQNFSSNTNNKHYSRNTSFGAIFAERFIRIIRDLLK